MSSSSSVMMDDSVGEEENGNDNDEPFFSGGYICTVPQDYYRISEIANYLDSVVTLIIPFFLITFFNVKIAICIWKLKDQRRSIVASSCSTKPDINVHPNNSHRVSTSFRCSTKTSSSIYRMKKWGKKREGGDLNDVNDDGDGGVGVGGSFKGARKLRFPQSESPTRSENGRIIRNELSVETSLCKGQQKATVRFHDDCDGGGGGGGGSGSGKITRSQRQSNNSSLSSSTESENSLVDNSTSDRTINNDSGFYSGQEVTLSAKGVLTGTGAEGLRANGAQFLGRSVPTHRMAKVTMKWGQGKTNRA